MGSDPTVLCKDKNVLKEYLESREKEVIDMMVTLFDEEKIMKAHDKTIMEQSKIEVIVKMCKRYNETIQEAVNQVMEELDYNEETATKEVRRYW